MVDLIVASQTGLRNPFETTTTASGAGDWSYVLNTAGFPMDTYQVKARAFVTGLRRAIFFRLISRHWADAGLKTGGKPERGTGK